MFIAHQRLITYFIDSYRELRKVIWPSYQETLRYTSLVVGVSLVLAIILGGFDSLFTYMIKILLSLKKV